MNRFSLYAYTSLIDTKGTWRVIGSQEIYQLINVLTNLGMTVNRWVYQVVDLGLQLFMDDYLLKEAASVVFKNAAILYQSLFNSLGISLFLIAIGSVFLLYAFKNPQEAFRKLFVLFMIIGLNLVIYSNGETYFNEVDQLFKEVETKLLAVINLPLDEDFQTLNKTDEPVEKVRELYFKMTLQRSFAMINFGKATYEERFDTFLYTDAQENDEQSKEELKQQIQTESKTNRYMNPDGALDKWFLSLYSCFNNLFVGIPLMVIASLRFLLKIILFLLIFGLPLASILSFIPKFSGFLFNLLGKMLLLLFIGAFVSVAVYIFFFLTQLIDRSILDMAGMDSLTTSILGTVSKTIFIALLMKGKGQIINIITLGNVTQHTSNKLKKIAVHEHHLPPKNNFSPDKVQQRLLSLNKSNAETALDLREITTIDNYQKKDITIKAHLPKTTNQPKSFLKETRTNFTRLSAPEERSANVEEIQPAQKKLIRNTHHQELPSIRRKMLTEMKAKVQVKGTEETRMSEARLPDLIANQMLADDSIEKRTSNQSEEQFYQELEALRTC